MGREVASFRAARAFPPPTRPGNEARREGGGLYTCSYIVLFEESKLNEAAR